mmetsp:Transcript_12507/g.22807  ORF Transcript_12507/g.22807 Transcript_12507/m.22807 type:complete len:205 (+) Transcript_12507:139-753(+)
MTLSDEIPTDLFRIRCEEKMKKEVQAVFSGSNDMVKKMKDVKNTDNEEGHISRVVYGVMFHSQPKAIALEMQFMKGDLKSVDKDLGALKKYRMKLNYKKFYEQVLEVRDQYGEKPTKKNIKQFGKKVFRWWAISTVHNLWRLLVALLRVFTCTGTVRSLVGAAKKIINDYRDWRNIQRLLDAGKPQVQQRNTFTSAEIVAGAKL